MSGGSRTACDGCAGGRRAFLRELAFAAAGVAAALGLPVHDAEGMGLRFVESLGQQAEEVTYPIPAADGVQIDEARDLILARAQGAVYAFSLACPHQNTALRWSAGQGQFVCPKHKSRYAPDGAFRSGRATRSMDRFAIRRADATVVVDLAKLLRSDREPEGWGQAVVRV